MTDPDRIATRVRELLAQVLDVPAAGIGSAFSAATVGSWTSLNHLMLVSQLESEFGVFFSSQQVGELTSYERIVRAVANQLGAAGG
jgi:acyl carrier protein